MVAALICVSCRPPFFDPEAEPEHCHGLSDQPAPKGVLGGMRCSCPCRYLPPQGSAIGGSNG